MAEAVFIAGADGGFTATDLARGPWDPDAQHGRVPAALLMHAFEALPAAPGLLIARVSYEFIRPAPVAALTVRADVIRPGRRVQLLEGSLIGPGATEVVRARALQVQRADPTASQPVPPGPALGPEAGRRDAPRIHREDMPSFGTDAMDIR